MIAALENRRFAPQRAGFTLVEIMVVILIVGLLAAMVGPPMYGYLQSHRLQSNTDRLVADLQFARSQSIATGNILRIDATEAGYRIIDTSTGTTLRQHAFDQGVGLAAAGQADFFPWGMSDNTAFAISNTKGAKQISLLPTGMVEVTCP